MSERYWILDPEGHRRIANEAPVEVPPGWEGAEIIRVAADPEDWCCDTCNATIPTRIADGSPAMVACTEGDLALCLACAVARGYVPGQPGSWSATGTTCGCSACHEVAIRATVREVGRRLPEHATVEAAT